MRLAIATLALVAAAGAGWNMLGPDWDMLGPSTKAQALMTNAGDDYASALWRHRADGRPLVVLVGAEWCAPCKVAERDSVPGLRELGHYAYVDVDREPRQAALVTGTPGPLIPQLVVYRHGRAPLRLIGPAAIATFLKQPGL